MRFRLNSGSWCCEAGDSLVGFVKVAGTIYDDHDGSCTRQSWIGRMKQPGQLLLLVRLLGSVPMRL